MIRFLFTLLLSAVALGVQAQQPSDASIERLLEVTQSRRMTETVALQVSSMMRPMFDQAVESKKLSPEQRRESERFMASFSEKVAPILASELSWERMKTVNIEIYRNAFTQEEIDGLIAFYESPIGKVVVEKVPQVMQKSMVEMQARMAPIIQKIQEAAAQSAAEFKAAQAATKK
jgi:hypothetical protein